MYFDNFLTAMSLLKGLGEKDVKTTGTIRTNCFKHCLIKNRYFMSKKIEILARLTKHEC